MLEDYRKARKLGLKQVSRDVSSGRYPYPPALDDIHARARLPGARSP